MKNGILIIILILGSCRSSKTVSVSNINKTILNYSKGPCLGNCPVYNIKIFENGKVLFNGISDVKKNGEFESLISLKKIKTLNNLLSSISVKDYEKISGRDKPITTLNFKENNIRFDATKSKGNLLKIEGLISQIVESI